MGQPLVSIIISSYNYASYVSQAIDSALAQTYPHIEVIVVDDGSKDDSPDIISGYGNKIMSVLKENGGQASAFNAGFEKSQGEVIIFLDSDDILSSTVVEEAVVLFSEPEVVKVHWILQEIDAAGKVTKKFIPHLPLSEGDLRELVIEYGPSRCGGPPFSPPTSGNAWSRDFLSQVFPIPEADYRTCTDQYLYILAPAYGQIRNIPTPHGFYRVHGKNYSLNPTEKYMQEYFERFERSCQLLAHHLQRLGIDNDPSSWPRNSWFHTMRAAINDIIDVVPYGDRLILIGGEEWGFGDILSGRHLIPFIEVNGQYGGNPVDDAQAILEIERHREEGVKFLFFTWTTFWWLDFYSGMRDYLNDKYECLMNNNRLIGFRLN